MRSAHWRCLVLVAAVVVLGVAGTAQAQCGPMDVVFVVDTTGSMGGVLKNVTDGLPSIITQVQGASGGDYRLGLLEFGTQVHVIDDMAAGNTDKIKKDIAALTAGGGANEPEASDEAIRTVVESLKASARPSTCGGACQVGDFNATFRPEAAKIIVMVTDARPAGFDDNFDPSDEKNVQSIATEAGGKGIHISAIWVPDAEGTSVGDTIKRIMQEWATLSGGEYLKSNPDGTGVADAIKDIVATCGGAGPTTGGLSLFLDPAQIPLSNGETGDVKVTNFIPGDTKTLSYSTTGLPDDSSVTFTPVKNPDPKGSDQQTMHITIGPDTQAGTYVLNVIAQHGDSGVTQSNYVLVLVDCTPPLILGTGQPRGGANGSTISVSPVGSLGDRYQWYRGHSGSTAFPISGATTSSLTTNGAGDYWVRVTNACGSTDSLTAVVTP